jgi:hypothetical protein
VVSFKVLSRYLPRTEGNHGSIQSGQSISRPRFMPVTSRINFKSVVTLEPTFSVFGNHTKHTNTQYGKTANLLNVDAWYT